MRPLFFVLLVFFAGSASAAGVVLECAGPVEVDKKD
jgi:hypothetical protein